MTDRDTPVTALPVGAVLASALMAANYPGDSGEDVDRLIDELAKRGYAVVRREAPCGRCGSDWHYTDECEAADPVPFIAVGFEGTWERAAAVSSDDVAGSGERLREAAQRFVDAVARCREQSEAAVQDKGAAAAFEEGYDPLSFALVEFGAAEDALRAVLSPYGPPPTVEVEGAHGVVHRVWDIAAPTTEAPPKDAPEERIVLTDAGREWLHRNPPRRRR